MVRFTQNIYKIFKYFLIYQLDPDYRRQEIPISSDREWEGTGFREVEAGRVRDNRKLRVRGNRKLVPMGPGMGKPTTADVVEWILGGDYGSRDV